MHFFLYGNCISAYLANYIEHVAHYSSFAAYYTVYFPDNFLINLLRFCEISPTPHSVTWDSESVTYCLRNLACYQKNTSSNSFLSTMSFKACPPACKVINYIT